MKTTSKTPFALDRELKIVPPSDPAFGFVEALHYISISKETSPFIVESFFNYEHPNIKDLSEHFLNCLNHVLKSYGKFIDETGKKFNDNVDALLGNHYYTYNLMPGFADPEFGNTEYDDCLILSLRHCFLVLPLPPKTP